MNFLDACQMDSMVVEKYRPRTQHYSFVVRSLEYEFAIRETKTADCHEKRGGESQPERHC